jgi:hypothetical protein
MGSRKIHEDVEVEKGGVKVLQDTLQKLNDLLGQIYVELGGEDPENWTKDAILNRIKELKKEQSNSYDWDEKVWEPFKDDY